NGTYDAFDFNFVPISSENDLISTELAECQHPKSQRESAKQIEKFSIANANFVLSNFKVTYNKNDHMCFYRPKNFKFPAIEIKDDYKLQGNLEITVFNNKVVFIMQK